MLHRMDGGLTQKLNFGALCMGIKDASRMSSMNKTQVENRFVEPLLHNHEMSTFCSDVIYVTLKVDINL